MADIKLLDCTLRDGGYVNNWQWGFGSARRIIQTLTRAGVDIVEVGFLRNVDGYDPDVTVCNTIEEHIWDLCLNSPLYPTSDCPKQINQLLGIISKKVFKRRGKGEISFDHLYRATFTSEIISERPSDVSSCDVGQRLVTGLKYPTAQLIECDISTMRGEFKCETRQFRLCKVCQRQVDTLSL